MSHYEDDVGLQPKKGMLCIMKNEFSDLKNLLINFHVFELRLFLEEKELYIAISHKRNKINFLVFDELNQTKMFDFNVTKKNIIITNHDVSDVSNVDSLYFTRKILMELQQMN